SVLTPIARDRAKLSITLASAPLCMAIPTGPGCSGKGTVSANGPAFACVLRKPRQLGPSRVILCAAARATRLSSSARPSSPVSRYPDASTIAPRTPATPASSSTPSTASGGTMMNAKSGGSARSGRLATVGLPNTSECCGWTGVSSPAKPVARALAKTKRVQADVGEAPTTAILRGAKNSARRPGVTSEPAEPGMTGVTGQPGLTCEPGVTGVTGEPGARVRLPRRRGVLGLGGASGGAAQPWSPAAIGFGPRLLRQPERTLADDVALDLAGTGVDRPGAARQEHVLPGGRRVAGTVWTDQRVRADDRDGHFAEPFVVLAPAQLGDRRLRPGLLALGHLRKGAQPAESH